MKLIHRLALGALPLVAGVALLGAPSPASASSGACTGTPGWVVGGQHVTVQDAASTFPSACVRITTFGVQPNANGTTTTSFGTRLRDTARDGQVAVALVKLYYPNGQDSGWRLAQSPTGNEYFSSAVPGGFTTSMRPYAVQFAACRSTSWSGFPNGACNLLTFWT